METIDNPYQLLEPTTKEKEQIIETLIEALTELQTEVRELRKEINTIRNTNIKVKPQ